MNKMFSTVFLSTFMLLAGCGQTDNNITNQKNMAENALQLKVSGYENGALMPAKFATQTGGGENVSPGLSWQPLPAAQSYALLFDDKHPVANNWVHWLVVDIPNTVTEIEEGASRHSMPTGSRELMTSWRKTGYDGLQPPMGSGNHEYVFHVYALDVPKLDVDEAISRSDFLKAVEVHVITSETYSGWFERR